MGADRRGPPANRPETAPQALEKMEFAPEKGVVPKACEAAPEDAENAHTARRDGVGAGSFTALRELPWSSASSRPHPEAPSRIGGLEGCGAQPIVRMKWSVLRQAQDEEKRSQPIAECSNEALPPADAPTPSAAACAGAEMAPQAIENIESAPGDGANPAAGVPRVVDAAAGRVSRAQRARLQSAAPEQGPPPPSPIEPPRWAMAGPEPVTSVLVPDLSAPGGFRRVNMRMLPNGMTVC